MFGYIVPPKNVTPAELGVFNAFYCGLCIRTGKLMGQMARLTVNYDMAFLSALVHDLKNQEVKVEQRTCIVSPIKKKSVISQNELMDRLVAVNIMLSYYKAEDGIVDGDGLKYKLAKKSLFKAYQASRDAFAQADEIICNGYAKLRSLEQSSVVGLDRMSDAFARMMQDLVTLLIGDKADENSVRLAYNIGKYVYLMDALDDIDEDFKAKRYNPFLALTISENFKSRQQFFNDNRQFIEFALNSTVNRVIECFNLLTFTQSYDLLRKIVYYGLREKVCELLASKSKLKKPIIKATASSADKKGE
ncbi:MAG: hypothetical protein IKC35_01035 [Clostridia bacterium]|nr:hypothetical protein [Clostridia bacterium]